MKDDKKLLVLPIEVKKREYLAKLYLGMLAANEGFQVVLGSHDSKAILRLRNGIYFYKDHAVVSKARLATSKLNGHKVFALDEEGLIYLSKRVYVSNRVSDAWLQGA